MSETEALKMPARLLAGISLGESHFREFKSSIDQTPPQPKAREVTSLCRDVA